MPALIPVAIMVGAKLAGFIATSWGAVALTGAITAASIAAQEIFSTDIPEPDQSPTYNSQNDKIGNTISEGIPWARCYGICKIAGNKLRFNNADADDLRVIVGHCIGEVEGINEWYINDLSWAELTGSHTKTEYKGTRAQTADARFSDKAGAYRGLAYTAFTFTKNDQQVGYDPNIVVVMKGLKCAPLAGGADAFTRNPSVQMYDWYSNVEGYSAGELNLNAFKSLDALCDAIPTGAGYYTEFPLKDDDHVKATSKDSTASWAYFATGRTVAVTGDWTRNAWIAGANANQRFHIDLGVAKVVKRIYYENLHYFGANTDTGANNFTLWGSNEAAAFAELTYGTDTDWTELTCSQNTFDEHIASDESDPQYIDITNSTAYRYYAIKIADNHGDASYVGFRRVQLQCQCPRYRFDYNYDANQTVNDMKKILWQSFNGRVIMSQGQLKPVWDSAQMADGAGGLTTKTVSHAFTEDNIVKDSFTWWQPEKPNIVRINFRDSARNFKDTSVEEKDELDIDVNGEIVHEETCKFITDYDIASRRAKFKFNRFKYCDYACELSSFSSASDLEVYDLVTVTHSLPGWTNKQFIVTEKTEDAWGMPKFTLEAYYPSVYDDSQVGSQPTYESQLPNPYKIPASSTSVSAAMTAIGTSYDYDGVRVTFTPPANDPFYSYSEVYASNNDSDYYFVGKNATGDFTFNGLGVIYEPGDTCYVKIRSVSTYGVKESLPSSADTSVSVSSTIRLGGFYAGADFLGDNATAANAKILLDKTNTLIRLGPTSGDYLILDGNNVRIRSSNYVAGKAGAGFTLDSDLLEVGNIAARGVIRTAVFQKDVISAMGGNFAVLDSDVLASDMTADDDSSAPSRETEGGDTRITEAGDTRITEDGNTRIIEGYAELHIEGNTTFAIGDILRIKDGMDDEWFEVAIIANAPIYGVIRDKAGAYGTDSNPAWKKGATVVNYKQSGDGGVYMTASDTNAPYLSVFKHAGAPWSTISTMLRLGNLNGYAGYSSDVYGIAGYIDASNFFKLDSVNGLQISGSIVLTNTISADSVVDGSTNKAYTGTEQSKLSGIESGADVTLAAINGGLSVTGGGITLSAGGAIKGGQTGYDTGTGWFLGYSGSAYKFSIGNASGDKITWDGSTLAVTGDIIATSNLVTNAATLPVTAYTSGDTGLFNNSTETTIQSATITSTGAEIYIISSTRLYNADASHAAGTRLTIYRNTTEIYRSNNYTVSSMYNSVTMAIDDTPGAGSVTYYVKAIEESATGTCKASYRSLMLLELKR